VDAYRKELRRIEREGDARFLTFSCYQRRPLLDDPGARDAVADQLHLTRSRLSFKLFAWVIMPEHVHLLLLPARGTTVPQILTAIKRPVAHRLIQRWKSSDDPRSELTKAANGQCRLWQAGGGYDRNIFTREELSEKLNYIHENPVRRGLVESPTDWVWSSYRSLSGLECRWAGIERTRGV
jgi:putative transposase